jgi:UDP-GlcNAc:undecaprenyl-phosphate GlcNAc-1-phosphate transferase
MFILGGLDDLKQFSPKRKLLVQLIATSLFVMTGAVIPVTEVKIFNILITYFWFIGIINAVNMLDNMDGLSSGVVFIAAGTVVVLSVSGTASPSKLLAIPIALSLMAALLGFWIYNRPPASIFMGDSGSLFIGYVIASLAIPSELNGYFGFINTEATTILALLIPATILAVPIFDTTLVTITRKLRAQKASQGGRDHSSHRLVLLGFKEKQVIWIFYSIALVAGLLVLGMQRYTDYALHLFSGFAIVLLLVGIYLTRMTAQIST